MSDNSAIPEVAVDAAMKAFFGDHLNMTAALEAAAPHMLADAWEAGESAGQDNASAYQTGGAVAPNPYKAAK